ncbi:unnamed protein product [Rangifer tarandus platyrhynchus]|uniref:Secreted protein n=1 Tax=Rangifer tarandus platyrhynchus TaxID=3082113 RepID=A0ABN8YI17_RANTA|nr:unnamed protein product [Rangifer tarandus platyrhynchus]
MLYSLGPALARECVCVRACVCVCVCVYARACVCDQVSVFAGVRARAGVGALGERPENTLVCTERPFAADVRESPRPFGGVPAADGSLFLVCAPPSYRAPGAPFVPAKRIQLSQPASRAAVRLGTRKFVRGRERVASKRARGSGSGAGDHGAAGASSAGVKAALPLPPESPRVSRGGCGRGRMRRV